MAADYRPVVAPCGLHAGAMMEGGIEVDAVNQAMDRSAWPANQMMRMTELAEAAAMHPAEFGRERGGGCSGE